MTASLYDTDVYLWTQEQSALIQERRWSEVDADLVAEEIADMGSEIRNACFSFIRRILQHLLKLRYSVQEIHKAHRRSEIANFRLDLKDRLTRSIENQVDIDRLYRQAVRLAVTAQSDEPGFSKKIPSQCPWTLEHILDEDYWPEPS